MSEQNALHILVVDDSATVRRTIIRQLGDDYIFHETCDGEQAWNLLENNESISLVFADMHMPVMNGMLLLKQIRSSDCERIASLPVIIITGYENAEAAKRASHNLGATDFISKPFDAVDLLDKVAAYSRVAKKVPVRRRQTNHDKLTGLLNESSLVIQGNRALEYSAGGEMETSMLSMQIVGLSDVFKQHGEMTTKQIIISIANHIDDAIRGDERAAHLGSGKFSVVLPATNEFKANIVAIRLQKNVTHLKFEKGDTTIRLKLAIGIGSVSGADDDASFDTLREQANSALQMSLEQPGHPIVRFDETYEKHCLDQNSEIGIDLANAESTDQSSDIDVSDMNRYWPLVMAGEFDKVPAYYVEAMVAPLQKFLEYAYTYTDVDMAPPAGMEQRKAG